MLGLSVEAFEAQTPEDRRSQSQTPYRSLNRFQPELGQIYVRDVDSCQLYSVKAGNYRNG
jgi:hypothetical protein